MPRLVRRWTVVCLDLHAAFDVFPSPGMADVLARTMNAESEANGKTCRYTVMDFYVTMMDDVEAKTAISKQPEKKERMN